MIFVFKRSFLFDKFEKVVGLLFVDFLSLLNYIFIIIIGDNEYNVIDLFYGFGDVVYINKGDNVVFVGMIMLEY